MRLPLALLLLTTATQAQWQVQQSNTTADLRGIHSLGNGVAWASGSKGTILRTTDDGATWKTCVVPPEAEALDFRGVQGFDAQTAIVMSSGKGSLSRLYQTRDGCESWSLLLANPDADGFWDAYQVADRNRYLGFLLGDPVDGHFPLWLVDRDHSAQQVVRVHHPPKNKRDEAAFAASNSAIFVADAFFDYWIATGGKAGARVIRRINHDFDSFGFDTFPSAAVPVGGRSESSGIFSLSFQKPPDNGSVMPFLMGVAVGGDYLKPEESLRTAAFTFDAGKTWTASTMEPHGYRSAVAYSREHQAWITVGPNGTDVSTDDGRNWRPLRPVPQGAPEEDQHWNALSLPFVVGPHGRIGLLRVDALKP